MSLAITLKQVQKAITTLSGLTYKGISREAKWAFMLTNDEIKMIHKVFQWFLYRKMCTLTKVDFELVEELDEMFRDVKESM